MKFYLARHGQDEDNANEVLNGYWDTPLTELGIRQSKKLANKLKKLGIKFDGIYTSPLKRARQTAEIITHTLNVKNALIFPELIERNFGLMTGKKYEEIQSMCAPHLLRTEHTLYFLEAQGAETFPQLLERAKLVLNKLDFLHLEGNVLLVTHGDLGKMIYAAYYQLAWKDVLKLFHFKNSELLILSPK